MSTEIVAPLSERIAYSKALAVSDLLPKQYRGKPENVLVAVEYGRALGLEPMAAMQGIHVVEGKPTASAQLIGALVRNAGHRLRVTGDATTARATIIRRDDPDFEFEAVWTIQRASTAGLTGKAVWKSYPAAMLKARAITEVARDACPEVLSGVGYTAEEIEHGDPFAGAAHTTPPPVPTTVTRETAPTPEPPADVDIDTGEIIDAEVVEEPSDSGQWQRLAIIAGNLGMASREDKHALIMAVCGRAITSAKDLTRAEAEIVEAALRRIEQSPDAQTLAADIASGGTIL